MPLSNYLRYQIDQLKHYLGDYLTEIGLKRSKKTFQCPHSFFPPDHPNYHEDSSPSATLTTEGTSFYCHSCGAIGDVIDLAQLHRNLKWGTATDWLIKKYLLGMHIEPPEPDASPYDYKPQYSPGHKEMTELRTKAKTNPLRIKRRRKKRDYEKVYTPEAPSVRPKRKYESEEEYYKNLVEEYRTALIEEGERILNTGRGVVLHETAADGRKVPINCPEQKHGAKEPINNLNDLKSAVERAITCRADVDNKMLGISLLNNILCLDLDVHDTDGITHLSNLETALGEELPLKHWERSRSGGIHIFFWVPSDYDPIAREGLVKKVDGLIDVDGIDVLAGTLSVVIPPSIGYVMQDRGEQHPKIVRNWYTLRQLPGKWAQLLSVLGRKLNELIDTKNIVNESTRNEVAV